MPRLVALGGLALLGDDGPLTGSAARGRPLALLAILARSGNVGLTREKLAAYLWPESDADRARHSLDQAIYTVRRALGLDPFVGGATTLALDHGAVESDVAEFVKACESGHVREAVALYAGPFLDGFHFSGSPSFEHWVDGERALLHRQWTAALESIAREVAAGGDTVAAVAYWRRLAAAEPLNSRVALGLMKALEAARDRVGALQAAAVHARLVRDELDTSPDPILSQYEAELRHDLLPTSSALPPAPERPAGGSDAAGTKSGAAVAGVTAAGCEADVPTPAGASPSDVQPEPVGGATSSGKASRPFAGRELWLGIVGATTVLAVLAILAGRGIPPDTARRSVAVAAFGNETGDAAFDPVARMAADWIVGGLVRTGLVRVVEGDVAGPGVESVVSGRLYRAGNTVWVQPTIMEPGTGVVLRALDPIAVPALNPTEALEPLRERVLGALGTLYDPRLQAWAESALRPPTFSAYQEFAAGLELHAVPRDPAGAAARFRRAADLDPDYVLPRLWLAWASMLMADWATADSVTVALRSQRERMSPLERAWHDRISASLQGDNEASYIAALRMVDIAPRSGWVLALANAALDTNRPAAAISALSNAGIENLGLEREHGWFLLTVAYHRMGEYREELAASEAAIADVGLTWGFLGPGLPALAALGRMSDLEDRLEEMRALPPAEDGVPRAFAGLLTAATELRAHDRIDEAVAIVDRTLDQLEEPAAGPEGGPARWVRLDLLYEMGWWQDAERMLSEASTEERSLVPYRAMAGLLAARRGDATTARRVANELAAVEGAFLFGEPTFWRARIEAVLGDKEAAVTLLRQAFAEGQAAMAWYQVHVSRDFDALRHDRSFKRFVRIRPAR